MQGPKGAETQGHRDPGNPDTQIPRCPETQGFRLIYPETPAQETLGAYGPMDPGNQTHRLRDSGS